MSQADIEAEIPAGSRADRDVRGGGDALGARRPRSATTRTGRSSVPRTAATSTTPPTSRTCSTSSSAASTAPSTCSAPTTTATCGGYRLQPRCSASTRTGSRCSSTSSSPSSSRERRSGSRSGAATSSSSTELVEKIGVDAARWYLVSRGHDQPIEIDVDLAAEQTQKNPVYYVQYAHARIAGIMRNAGDAAISAEFPPSSCPRSAAS